MHQPWEGLLRMAVANSCLAEKRAPLKPLTAVRATAIEKKLKVSNNNSSPLGIIISIIPSTGQLELNQYEFKVRLDVRKLEIETE
ncbi:hypothetical protein ACFX13_019364 [Malus domestica]